MPAETPATDTIFYDGHCGLCHHWVRFAVLADREGRLFRFAPLQGETFRTKVPASARAALPDSIVLQTADGSLIIRSDAVISILRRLGSGWRAVGTFFYLIPRPLRDAAYDWVARMRTRWFARPEEICPVLPDEIRQRFDP
jgi:predicted DCC family thiol-disulfide oxidoreductase YuxK